MKRQQRRPTHTSGRNVENLPAAMMATKPATIQSHRYCGGKHTTTAEPPLPRRLLNCAVPLLDGDALAPISLVLVVVLALALVLVPFKGWKFKVSNDRSPFIPHPIPTTTSHTGHHPQATPGRG